MSKFDHTLGVHAGREDLRELGVHALPVDLSTTYPLNNLDEGTGSLDTLVAGAASADNPVYARLYNPTVARFENALARLEAAEAAVGFSSGMAARSEEHTSELQSRGHLVCRLLLEKKKT